MFGLSAFDIEVIVALLQSHREIETALVFGSCAMGNYKPGSDIDIALQGADVNDALAGTVYGELNERSPLPYKFDVVACTDYLTADLKTHIDTYGIVLYHRSNQNQNK